jgi:RNA polymerase sigma-70 factor, ECF subfamily
MFLRDLTFTEVERLQPRTNEADDALQMDQDTFRSLYEKTSRPLWTFLWRRTGDSQVADDLLQETYYRFLRTRGKYESDAHRRNYLFRIATNLANDSFRRRKPEHISLSADGGPEISTRDQDIAVGNQQRTDLDRAMSQLPSRQRDALWLAYVEGSSHEEIAGILGMKVGSIKLMLFRARGKVAKLLRGGASTGRKS